MKTHGLFRFCRIAGFILTFLLILSACKKEEKDTIPSVLTVSVSEITSHTAKVITRVTADGGSTVTGAGVCWAKTINPDFSENVSNVGQGTGEFISILTGLEPNITYYVRAFATNMKGTAFGENLNFTTRPGTIMLTKSP